MDQTINERWLQFAYFSTKGNKIYKTALRFPFHTAILGYSVLYEDAINWDMERTNALIGKQLRVVVTKTDKGEKSYSEK
jgi:hypothetical protein